MATRKTKVKSKSKNSPRMRFTKPGVTHARGRKSDDLSLPKKIFAQVSPHSIGGTSMFDVGAQINAETVANFTSEADLIQLAATRLSEAGFEVLQASESTINIAGTAKTYEKAFGAPIEVKQKEVIKEFGKLDVAEFLDCPNNDMPGLISTKGTNFENIIEGVALEEPRYYMAEDAYPPSVDYWHLDVPADVSLGCNADRAHRSGLTGKDIVVSMVDSGWYRHKFFRRRGYRVDSVVLGPGASNPDADESGHGTGESANIFANAPDILLKPVKMNFVNSIGSFNAAVGLNPDIITCSWGSSSKFGPLSASNIALANAVSAAVASGIVVVFSAGNGHWGFPGQHPDVISAGGVYMEADGSLRASDYSSGFDSNIYPGRRVPDLCGLVGMRPGANYIMLPVEPGDDIDQGKAGGSFPNGDETANNDGWAAFSGTSAAAPQLAGVVALIKQACNRLTPAEIREILKTTARDVTQGRCNPNTSQPDGIGGNPATTGVDKATGHGKVNAYRATLKAKLRCRFRPIRPIQPVQPISPVRPIQPVQPISPVRPIQPVQPISPVRPIQPIQPVKPIRPIQPIKPIGPVVQEGDCGELSNHAQLRADSSPDVGEEDLDELEAMVKSGQIDPAEI